MTSLPSQVRNYSAPWVRVFLVVLAVMAIALIARQLTGSYLPSDAPQSLIFQNALLLVVLGSTVAEHNFTKPSESLINALMGVVTLLGVYNASPRAPWLGVFFYCATVFILAAVCVGVSTGEAMGRAQRAIARAIYRPVVVLGRARLLFSVLFLFGVFSYYTLQSPQAITLILFWGSFVVLWPLGVPELISSIWAKLKSLAPLPIGHVVRWDAPNQVYVELAPGHRWNPGSVKILQNADGGGSLVLPLYHHTQGEKLIGFGVCVCPCDSRHPGIAPGVVYEPPVEQQLDDLALAKMLGADPDSRLIGLVTHDSHIAQLRFETWDAEACHEGMLVFATAGPTRVFYQITDGLTGEEAFQANRRGYQVATAAQLGVLDPQRGFVKHTWLPPMNALVFGVGRAGGDGWLTPDEGDFVYGEIPNTAIKISGRFQDFADHHTAILGVTGSGKTELAFDLVRHAVNHGVKVICVDLTARYADRLSDLRPRQLSLESDISKALSDHLFGVETGQYGGRDEKKDLRSFDEQIRTAVDRRLQEFLDSTDENDRVGLITLEEIANTKATLHITEIFLSTLLHLARTRDATGQRILVVLEEAHTVVPEPATMGIGDYDSKGVVGKIAQIALQGRKYGVGLLVIAQRTATVSKSILTQCNTVISFTCVDETSLNYLSNVFGPAHTRLIPNLPRLHAVMFGKGVRSERPLVVAIPFSDQKDTGEPPARGPWST